MDKYKNGVPRADAMNVIGLSALINPQNVSPNINIKEIENDIVGRSVEVSKMKSGDNTDISLSYEKQLKEYANDIGIDFSNDINGINSDKQDLEDTKSEIRSRTSSKKPKNLLAGKSLDQILGEFKKDIKNDSNALRPKSSRSSRSTQSTQSSRSTQSTQSSRSSDSSDSSRSSNSSSDMSTRSGSTNSGSDTSRSRSRSRSSSKSHIKEMKDFNKRHGIRIDRHGHRNREHHKYEDDGPTHRNESQVDTAMNFIRNDTNSSKVVEHHEIKDSKITMIAEIEQLKEQLTSDDINVESYPTPTVDSTYESIKSVLDALKNKYDQNRYSSLAEEILIGAATLLETVFDGTREIPLFGWRPDYTGYHNTVNVKLNRMQYETSNIVGRFFKKNHISDGARCAMELLPTLFTYPKVNANQNKQQGISTSTQKYQSAMSSVRRSDSRMTNYSAKDMADI